LEVLFARVGATLLVLTAQLVAQSVIGATAGMISFASGRVYLDNKAIEVTAAHLPAVKPNAVLRTDAGGRR
jgi:hypothetical protein